MLHALVLIQLVACLQATPTAAFGFGLGSFDVFRNVQQLFDNPILSILNSVAQANNELKTTITNANETMNQLETTRKNLVNQVNEASAQCNSSAIESQRLTYDLNDIDHCYNASLIMQQAYLTSINATNFILSTTNDFYLATTAYETCTNDTLTKIPECMRNYTGNMKTILVQTKPTAVNYELTLREFRTQFMVEIRICFGLEDQANAALQAKLKEAQSC